MKTTVNIPVKGTSFYKAKELFQKGFLSQGMPIQLEHQTNNPHDKNAVAVKLKRKGEMLGHISKELAPKYSKLVNEGKVIEVLVSKIEMNGKYLNIDIKITYENNPEQQSQKNNSRLWLSSLNIKAEAGIYTIQNLSTGRQYIGSSANLNERIKTHTRDLFLGRHPNHALQSDFSRLGPEDFEAKALIEGIPVSQLTIEEADKINSLLNSGAALYNFTADGQGSTSNYRNRVTTETISDRFHRRRAAVDYLKNPEKEKALRPDGKSVNYYFILFIVVIIILATFT
jgi:hypothetical protein